MEQVEQADGNWNQKGGSLCEEWPCETEQSQGFRERQGFPNQMTEKLAGFMKQNHRCKLFQGIHIFS